jgi:hypothetical protein
LLVRHRFASRNLTHDGVDSVAETFFHIQERERDVCRVE